MGPLQEDGRSDPVLVMLKQVRLLTEIANHKIKKSFNE